MAYMIEKNIPYQRRFGGAVECKYPWPQMEVGDSVLIDKYQTLVCRLAGAWGRKHGRKFKTSKVDAAHTRVWRTA
jgi:hypothetical protein